jgi:hypothetical protein
MVNDGSCNSNNSHKNDIENPSSTLEHLLIVHAQLLHTAQQVMVQMQDINQLMQSMKVRPPSRKRKSNTQNDVGQAQKISAIKKAAPNHKEGSTLAKATMICFNCGEVSHYANRCPKIEEIRMFKAPNRPNCNPKSKGQEVLQLWIEGSLCSSMPQPTCLPSSDTVIYFSTTTQPASRREGGSALGSLRMGMT